MKQPAQILRFTTAGSVDDGKSTLIGRLLYDSKAIFEDQYQQMKTASERKGEESVNLALLTDGLRAEREQGITIDVAYRYFSTPARKFIIADTPGHIQYTRNMVTGASTANVALILVDARKGITEQTRRHAIIASLLQIPHMIVCINKMDLVDFSEEDFDSIRLAFTEFASRLLVKDIQFIPVCALQGDNVVSRSERMPWYQGTTLLYALENVHIAGDHNLVDCRFPVQLVIRPNRNEYHDFRAYAGRVAGGIFKKGDEVMLLPSGFTTRISSIYSAGLPVEKVMPPQCALICLEDDYDLSRGDMIVREHNAPRVSQDLEVMLCWFHYQPFQLRKKYVLMHTHREVRCMVKELRYKLDINTLHRDIDALEIGMNDICRVHIRTTRPLFTDSYRNNRQTGSIILIDEDTNDTVAAGMII